MIDVVLPFHLARLARVGRHVALEVEGQVTVRSILDTLETRYPELRGTIRDHGTLRRRAFLRFFACGEDVSLAPEDLALPRAVAEGTEPFMVVGAMAGG